MPKTLLSIAILSALSLPGVATAEVGPFDTENRAHPLGIAPPGHAPVLGDSYYKIEWVEFKKPQPGRAGGAGVQSPRDAASGQATGIRSPRDPAPRTSTGDQPELQRR